MNSSIFLTTVTYQIYNYLKMQLQKTCADDLEYKEMMKRKRLEKGLDAADPDYVPDEGNRKSPPKHITITISKTNDASLTR